MDERILAIKKRAAKPRVKKHKTSVSATKPVVSNYCVIQTTRKEAYVFYETQGSLNYAENSLIQFDTEILQSPVLSQVKINTLRS